MRVRLMKFLILYEKKTNKRLNFLAPLAMVRAENLEKKHTNF